MAVDENNIHVDDLIDLYVLGALEADEQTAVDEHLEGCARCRARLEEARQVAQLLAWTPEQYDPPPELLARTMQRIQHLQQTERRAQTSPPWWQRLREAFPRSFGGLRFATAALAVLMVLLGGRLLQLQQELGEARTQLAAQEQELVTLRSELADQQQLVAMLGSPDARLVSLSAQQDATPVAAHLLIDPDSPEAYFVSTALEPLPADHTYQLWLIADGQPTSAGVFQPDAHGRATFAVEASRPLSQYQAAGITIEPAGGSAQPTSEPILLSEF